MKLRSSKNAFMWVNITEILFRSSKDTFSYPKHLQGKSLPSILTFSLKVFSVLHFWIKSIQSRVFRKSSGCYSLCILTGWGFAGVCLFVFFVCLLVYLGFCGVVSFLFVCFCTFLFLQSVSFLFFPLEVWQSGFMELIPFLLPTYTLTLQPHRLQDISREKVELYIHIRSCEVTASSSEGKAHRHVLCADQSLSFAEICSTSAANCGWIKV